jgi:hypothetical protein
MSAVADTNLENLLALEGGKRRKASKKMSKKGSRKLEGGKRRMSKKASKKGSRKLDGGKRKASKKASKKGSKKGKKY